MSKKTKRQRLKSDPMNQRRGKVKAWARKYGAIVSPYWPVQAPDTELRLSRHLFLVGYQSDAKHPFHPNNRVARRAFR